MQYNIIFCCILCLWFRIIHFIGPFFLMKQIALCEKNLDWNQTPYCLRAEGVKCRKWGILFFLEVSSSSPRVQGVLYMCTLRKSEQVLIEVCRTSPLIILQFGNLKKDFNLWAVSYFSIDYINRVIIRSVGLVIREKRKELLIQFRHVKHKFIPSWKKVDYLLWRMKGGDHSLVPQWLKSSGNESRVAGTNNQFTSPYSGNCLCLVLNTW